LSFSTNWAKVSYPQATPASIHLSSPIAITIEAVSKTEVLKQPQLTNFSQEHTFYIKNIGIYFFCQPFFKVPTLCITAKTRKG
jgi:hypothetical protein